MSTDNDFSQLSFERACGVRADQATAAVNISTQTSSCELLERDREPVILTRLGSITPAHLHTQWHALSGFAAGKLSNYRLRHANSNNKFGVFGHKT